MRYTSTQSIVRRVMMDILELRDVAKKQLNHRQLSPVASAGSVAAAILTSNGNVFTGVCIDTPAGMGFCAEHSAAAAMINAGESQIAKLVTIGVDDETACAPCGRCREFLSALNEQNYKCDVLIDGGEVTTLGELLPYRL